MKLFYSIFGAVSVVSSGIAVAGAIIGHNGLFEFGRFSAAVALGMLCIGALSQGLAWISRG